MTSTFSMSSNITHHAVCNDGQFSKLSLRRIASWKSSTTSLQLIRQQHGFPCGASSNSSSRNARSFRWYLPACLLAVRRVLLKRTFGISPLPWTPDPSRGSFGVVPLLCVLDLSPTGRSPLEVTQRRFVPSDRAPLHFILGFVHVTPVRSRSVSGTFTWLVSDLIRVCGRFSFMSRITLARFHLQRPLSQKKRKLVVGVVELHRCPMSACCRLFISSHTVSTRVISILACERRDGKSSTNSWWCRAPCSSASQRWSVSSRPQKEGSQQSVKQCVRLDQQQAEAAALAAGEPCRTVRGTTERDPRDRSKEHRQAGSIRWTGERVPTISFPLHDPGAIDADLRRKMEEACEGHWSDRQNR